MSNADSPASAFVEYSVDGFPVEVHEGLSKREHFCLQMGVPETGDPELDDIIRKANKQKFAAMAMQGICASGPTISNEMIASEAVGLAEELLKGLDK